MEARELRIGNKVYIPKTKQVADIFAIQELFGVCVNRNVIAPLGFNEIEPIELTEDWLLKFGFTTDENGEEYKIGSDDIFMVQNTMKEVLAHVWDGAFTDAPIKYVHQLQNLYFSLTGEDLTFQSKQS